MTTLQNKENQTTKIMNKYQHMFVKDKYAYKQYDIMYELDVQKYLDLNHSNILKIYEINPILTTHSDNKYAYIIKQEFANQGSLQQYIYKNNVNHDQKRQITKQLCNGLQYLHTLQITHMDLTLTNVLIHKQENKLIVKISDYMDNKNTPLIYQHLDPKTTLSNYQQDIYQLAMIIYYIYNKKMLFAQIKNQGASINQLRKIPAQLRTVVHNVLYCNSEIKINDVIDALDNEYDDSNQKISEHDVSDDTCQDDFQL